MNFLSSTETGVSFPRIDGDTIYLGYADAGPSRKVKLSVCYDARNEGNIRFHGNACDDGDPGAHTSSYNLLHSLENLSKSYSNRRQSWI